MKDRIVVFDWDGTLVDSVDHIARSLQHAARELGYPERPLEALRDIIGLGMVEALEKLYPGIGHEEMQRLRNQYADHFFSEPTTRESLFPGVPDLLAQLSRQTPLAVATGKSRRGLDQALVSTGLGPFFRITRCADETRSKPHPRMLEEIMAFFGAAPVDLIMIGDTVYDMEMAQAAGVPAVGVTWGVHDAPALREFNPRAVVSTMDELADILVEV